MKCICFAFTLSVAAVCGAVDRVSLDAGWFFSLDGAPAVRVDVPHDWSIEAAPDAKRPSGAAGGYYPGGVGVYTRTFGLTTDDLERNVSLVFDGVFRCAEVSVNGGEAFRGSRYGYTGFRVPLSRDSLKTGTNTLVVTVRNDEQPNCRWYSGSGIFRHVWLEKRGEEFVVPGTLNVETVSLAPAEVRVSGVLTNTANATMRAVAKNVRPANAVLWTPETPALYETDFYGEKVKYGVRTVSWNKERGFVLNGKGVLLHGACVHHDHGPLGAASHDDAEIRKVRQLKRAGFNAVRTSHNPVSEAFLTACDAEGLLVVDDMFDGWRWAKTNFDYGRDYGAEWDKDLSWIVARDRIHPSVVMWSIGNEILERTTKEAVADSRAMVARVKELDAMRPVTMALCEWSGEGEWIAQDELASTLDVVGYNYTEKFIDNDMKRAPERVVVCTETYPCDAANLWRLICARSNVLGEFVWTGIDYLGEATIGRTYYEETDPRGEHYEVNPVFPWHGAYCGDIDVTGWRKPISHLRETLWNPQAPTYVATREPDGWKGKIKLTRWSVWPTWESWNYEGWEGRPVTVEVYSRKPRVRLTLNGRVVGERHNGPENAFVTQFKVPYEPGELVACGLPGGNEGMGERAIIKTAGEFDHFVYDTERIGRFAWVVATAVDKDGNICPNASVDVTFEGDVVGTCSADMRDSVAAPSRTRRTWHGRAMAVIRCGQ